MASVTFSTSVGGNNTTVTDDASPTTGLANGGHRTRFVPALSQIVAIAQFVVNTANSINAGTINAATVTATDVTNNILRYPAMVDGTGAGQAVELSTARWTMNPSTGAMSYTGTMTVNGATTFTGAMGLTGNLNLTGSLNVASGAVNEVQGATVASAATINLDATTGNYVDVSGTTGITAITLSAGRKRTVRFTGSLTLTNSANLVLFGGANITTVAGDIAEFVGGPGLVVYMVNFSPASAGAQAVRRGGDTMTGALNMNAAAINEAQGASIASAATVNLDAATGNLVDMTGNTSISAITLAQGRERTLRFTETMQLVHSAYLVCPGGKSITTAAGDFAIVRGYSSGVVRVVAYTPGAAIVGPPPAQTTFTNSRISAGGALSSITIAVDEIILHNSVHASYLATNVAINLNMAASGANGLDTGTVAASTWYALFVIYNPSTNTVATIASASFTSPTIPIGYTYKARIGVLRTDATANKYPLAFHQYGRNFQYNVLAGSNVTSAFKVASGTTAGYTAGSATITWAAIELGSFISPTASRVRGFTYNTGAQSLVLAPSSGYAGDASTTNPPPLVSRNAGALPNTQFFDFQVGFSGSLYWGNDGANNGVFVIGFEDNL